MYGFVNFLDIDDCPGTDPCENGACADLVNDYTCTCDPGYDSPTKTGCTGKLYLSFQVHNATDWLQIPVTNFFLIICLIIH